MLTQILSISDIEAFVKQITAKSVSFHSDNYFNDYLNLYEYRPFFLLKMMILEMNC